MSTTTSADPIVLAANQGERLSFRGVEILFKSPAETGEGWTALEYTMPPRQFGAPLHYNRELTETFYVLSGALWMRVGDREITAEAGAFVLVTPGTIHSFANRTCHPVTFLAHASDVRHKAFLTHLLRLAESEPSWPPPDPSSIVKLGRRYDTIYV